MPYVSSEESRKYYREYKRKWRLKHPDRDREIQRKSRSQNLEKERARSRAYRAKHPDTGLKWRAENRDRYRALDRRRRGLPEPTRPCPSVCECCGEPPQAKGLCLDHCHETVTFRGWLCGACNLAIGNLGDSEAGLLRALEYLRRSKA